MTTAPLRLPSAIRSRIPSLAQTVHLAACSIAPRSTGMDQALAAMLDDLARPGVWSAAENQVTEARRRFAHLIGADTDQVAVLPNVSIAAHQAVSGLRWRRRRDLLSTTAEFPGVAHVWLAQEKRGARVRWCGPQGGRVTAEDYLRAITTDTALVSVPAVTHRDATRLNIRRIADAAHAAGAAVIVDAYQAAGVMPLHVDALRCDYLITGTGKYLLGLPGLAFLYARHPDGPAPGLTGWMGRTDPHTLDPTRLDFPSHARRFETGTPAVAAAYAAVAGLTLIQQLNLTAVRDHTQRLIASTAHRLTGQGEIVDLAPKADERGAHLALIEPHAWAMAAWLEEHGIAVAARRGVVRVALHAYTNHDDIDALCDALAVYRVKSRTQTPIGASR
ncbi:aminotransferase class V-fold PLP-dependent enzyme [Micromonospora sp. CNB394]|uniref:aminotransferase class V-fold PLP-dependent enzyme n=1 Tax=Micromonospora sp. CNB394 TaxID=1169151 RepID=UPI0004783124|nr:aminotransferase class V-fold PLP-dependent enzyme [Micromonospora sp. CNB394]